MRARSQHPLSAAISLIVIIVAWLLLAPASVGGQAAYVIINGASMEPGMRRGDLAILQVGADYAVGDVATYRHPQIGPIIHRIIARDGERFVFQGDNNNFIDSYRPRADELLGRLWIYIPRAGALLQALRWPPMFAALATVMVGTALMTPASVSPRPRRRREPLTASPLPHDSLSLLSNIATICAALGLAALALATISFTRPTTRQVQGELAYSQHGRFDYVAPAPAGLYDGAYARAGDPLFLQVTETLPVSFTYQLRADAPATLAGVARLDAVLSDGAGWRRTFQLGAPVAFVARTATVTGTLDLAALQEMIATYEALSGVPRGQYRLDLSPEVLLQGSLAGLPLVTSYRPQLRFTLDAKALRPVGAEGRPAFSTEEAAALSYQREEPAPLALGPLRLKVTSARRLALVGLEIALVGGLLAGWRLRRAAQASHGAAIRLRYGHLLVRTEDGDGGAWSAGAVPLATPDELGRMAERLGQPILMVERGGASGYYVRDGASVYTVGQGGAPRCGEAA